MGFGRAPDFVQTRAPRWVALLTAIVITVAPPLGAATLTWDAGDTTNGATIDPANGTWDLASAVWNNGTSNLAWTLKRGVMGAFHHISKKHLHRYCDEFSFRWNGRKMTDTERRDDAIRQIEGKRLFYKQPIGEA